ncbi:MAG: type IV toxin-antitoxin system AbiEi family antitoxin domain-containing protein [Firmicutes bacterium]|nr:type IV toxin-antitoxin system AbiEi family antitoxin domain-containing protein [Bacillota bacterium]
MLVKDGNGYLLTSTVVEHFISKHTLADYVRKNGLQKVAHGVYMSEDTWLDELYVLYLRNRKIIFSYETALYLHGLSDREPFYTTVTVPKGYNAEHLKAKGIHVSYIKDEWYEVGLSKVQTNMGNTVPVYDRERTICDIIRNKKDIEIQTYQTAIKEYMSGKKNLPNLMNYARLFNIEKDVRTYTEVML